MPQQNANSVALDFLKEWDEGRQPQLTDYLATHPADADDILESVADCLIFEALARPPRPSAAPTFS